MATKHKITNLEGYFDVRIFNAKLPREQWAIKGKNDIISFVARDVQLPEGNEFSKVITRPDGTTYNLVKFKIGKNCRWFDKNAKAIATPAPEELEGKRWLAHLYFSVLPKDENQPTKACGLWCDAIMVREVENNPFAEFADEIDTPAPAPAADKLPNVRCAQDDSGLPF